MARNLLNPAQLDAAKVEPGKTVDMLSDGGGLYLRTKPNGTKSWVYVFRLNGRQRRMGLGAYPAVSLANARKNRNAAETQLENRIDPILARKIEDEAKLQTEQEKKLELEGKGPPKTVTELFNIWRWGRRFEPVFGPDTPEGQKRPKGPLGSRKDGGEWVAHYFKRDVFPVFGDKKPSDVRASDIWTVKDRMKERNPEVSRLLNMTLSNLRQMFRFAISREYMLNEPTLGITKRNFGGIETPRARWLEEHELRELPGILNASNLSEVSKLMVWILLATGCRVGEMTMSRRENVSVERRDWFFPAEIRKGTHEHPAKNHHVYLSDFVIARLQELEAITGDSPYLFPHKRNRNTHMPVNSLRRQITTDAGETVHTSGGQWTPHDLRRTLACHLESFGTQPKVIDKCIGHYSAGEGAQGAYFHWQYTNESRIAWEKWATKLAEIYRQPDA